MQRTSGQLLKQTRESKGISRQEAAVAINMTGRHIQALEEDNFSIFPGETYALGFLKSYASFLDLNPDQLVQLYRGAQLVEKEVPLQELTKPMITFADYFEKYSKLISAALVLIILIIVAINFFGSDSNPKKIIKKSSNQNSTSDNFVPSGSTTIPEQETENITLERGSALGRLDNKTGIDFSLENKEVYLVMSQLSYKTGKNGTSSATLLRYPGRIKLQLDENVPVLIQDKVIPRDFKVTLMGATPNSIKIAIQVVGYKKEVNDSDDINESSKDGSNSAPILDAKNYKLIFIVKAKNNVYVDFYVDGQSKKTGTLSKGEVLSYAAENSIQFKIGDADSVDVSINQKEYNWKSNEPIHKIVRKVKSPVDGTFSVSIKDL